jgi:hypothetical protein
VQTPTGDNDQRTVETEKPTRANDQKVADTATTAVKEAPAASQETNTKTFRTFRSSVATDGQTRERTPSAVEKTDLRVKPTVDGVKQQLKDTVHKVRDRVGADDHDASRGDDSGAE